MSSILNSAGALNSLLIETQKILHYSSSSVYKVLLLGCGHVGKSTIFKQVCKIYGNGFEQQDYDHTRQNVYDSIIDQIKMLIEELQYNENNNNYNFSLPIMTDEAKQSADYLLSPQVPRGGVDIDDALKTQIQTVWDEPNIKHILNENCSIAFEDGYGYFLDDLDRISDPNYTPNDTDIIRAYIPTTGIRSTTFNVNNCKMEVIDTGGQRNERNKWIHQFQHVHCMVFLVALDHFDQTLFEEEDINGLHESLALFWCLMNRREFRNTQIVLILSFVDSFENKIENKGKCLADYFDGYNEYKLKRSHEKVDIINGYLRDTRDDNKLYIPPLVLHLCAEYYGNEAKRSLDFLIDQFKAMVPAERLNKLHIYPAVCTETDVVENIFDDIGKILVDKHPPYSRNYWYIPYGFSNEGWKEIKIAFPVVVLSLTVMCVILIFTPFYALSYLEMAISSVLFFIACGLVGCLYPNFQQQNYFLFLFLPITTLMVVFNAVQISLYQLQEESTDYWTWVVYILSPLGLISIYIGFMSDVTFYWYWHQMWTLLWFGIMLIIVGVSINVNVDYVIWIIGVCCVILSFMVPVIAYFYLKRKLAKIRL